MFWDRDVLELWPDEPAETANRLVERAERFILAAVPVVARRVDAGELSAELVCDVIESLVTRAFERKNREGLTSYQLPEVGLQWDNSGGLGKGSLFYLTTDEYVVLSGVRNDKCFSFLPYELEVPA